jgi:hypothetical protein
MKLKKTQKQKGGSANATNASSRKKNNSLTQPEKDYLEAIEYLGENKLDNIRTLFEGTFGKNKKISFNGYLKDPFLQGGHDADYYHQWYKGINPEYKIISQLTSKDENGDEKEFKLPEFKTFVANLAKDILMMILKQKFNDSNETNNNKKTYLESMVNDYKNNIPYYEKQVMKTQLDDKQKELFLDLLIYANDIIFDEYIYIDVQNLYLEFIELVSIHKSLCATYIPEIIKIYEKTPYIIYPSYWTLDFKEIINLCSTPIINFKYMNRRRLLHDSFGDPCFHLDHDILFHGGITHSYAYYFSIPQNNNNNNNNNNNKKSKKMRDIEEMKTNFKKYFDTMNNILTTLNEYYDYNEILFKNRNGNGINNTKKEYESLDIELKKLCFGIVLFYVLHENNIPSSENSNNIKSFSRNGSIIQFLKIIEDNIGTDDDPNSPTKKYPIVTQINWNSVYKAFVDKLNDLGIESSLR